jgi:hypothetical protein
MEALAGLAAELAGAYRVCADPADLLSGWRTRRRDLPSAPNPCHLTQPARGAGQFAAQPPAIAGQATETLSFVMAARRSDRLPCLSRSQKFRSSCLGSSRGRGRPVRGMRPALHHG